MIRFVQPTNIVVYLEVAYFMNDFVKWINDYIFGGTIENREAASNWTETAKVELKNLPSEKE